jgi:hypothetical protein
MIFILQVIILIAFLYLVDMWVGLAWWKTVLIVLIYEIGSKIGRLEE